MRKEDSFLMCMLFLPTSNNQLADNSTTIQEEEVDVLF